MKTESQYDLGLIAQRCRMASANGRVVTRRQMVEAFLWTDRPLHDTLRRAGMLEEAIDDLAVPAGRLPSDPIERFFALTLPGWLVRRGIVVVEERTEPMKRSA